MTIDHSTAPLAERRMTIAFTELGTAPWAEEIA